jgi:NTP pyrophosphatase (non-canonical NTP hydrolase)
MSEKLNIINMVELWAEKRNFFKNDNTNTLQQSMKLLEETGELVAGINKNKKEEIKDAIGDMIVVMIIISKLENEKINQTLIFDDYPTEKEAEIDNYNLKDEKY